MWKSALKIIQLSAIWITGICTLHCKHPSECAVSYQLPHQRMPLIDFGRLDPVQCRCCPNTDHRLHRFVTCACSVLGYISFCMQVHSRLLSAIQNLILPSFSANDPRFTIKAYKFERFYNIKGECCVITAHAGFRWTSWHRHRIQRDQFPVIERKEDIVTTKGCLP